ncbi:hypothetical protein [Roseivirga echinicomitans]|uniref:Uncharacterized protein n=1 Tax=Roseivirga echinicomitans TaxID=296218 RepID=A0A150XDI3_9BACT|nr:hypothetical protein [Roseivirga echinicomitans]KYG76773.1 hypothetical protein AWN68_07040 [Roseivirga echinicomitans]
MKLPSLVKKPNYQRYDIKPRYYDPVKEDIENRTSRIKAEMGMNENANLDPGYRSQIEGSFRKNMKHAKNGVDQTIMLRLIIFVILILFVGGFVYIGKDIFYLALLYVPYLIWKKMRK